MANAPALARADSFRERFGLDAPVLLAPMAGACPPALSAAVMKGGGMGGCGALLMAPDAITAWADEVRTLAGDAFQMNLWLPDPPPRRDAEHEARLRTFLGTWGPPVEVSAGDAMPLEFDAQFDALLQARPRAASSIMGLFSPADTRRLKERGIAWFACVTTVEEARLASEAGADALVVQGAEAGGHRGTFQATEAERRATGLFALLPAVADAVDLPLVATGGIGDARGVAAALTLGAAAVQVGTGFLRCPESGIAPAWAAAMADAAPDATVLTRAFSGRAGRSIATAYVMATAGPGAPEAAPYPVQRGLSAAMRKQGTAEDDLARIQAWCGQAARLARTAPAAEIARDLWRDAAALLR